MKMILSLTAAIAFTAILGFSCIVLLKEATYKDMEKRERTRFWLQILVLLIVIGGSYCGRKLYIDYKHPYKDLYTVGTWDYSYSVTFDADDKLVRTDKELFSLEMYTETEITLNDDGSFRICIEDIEIAGTWSLDEHNSNILLLSPDYSSMDGIFINNEIRWDKGEDKLCIGLSKDRVPENLRKLFLEDERYRYIFCKTYRDNVRVVYSDEDNVYYEDEWNDGDNGLPFNYHP